MVMFLTARRSREPSDDYCRCAAASSQAFDFWQLLPQGGGFSRFLATVVQTEGYWPTGVSRIRLLSRAANPPRWKFLVASGL